MHGHTTPRPGAQDPKSNRIAILSEEYLSASPKRREEIGEEISGLISGTIIPLQTSH